MASYTPNYNLKKPADADTYDIADANGNMDLIDTALHSQNEVNSSYQSLAKHLYNGKRIKTIGTVEKGGGKLKVQTPLCSTPSSVSVSGSINIIGEAFDTPTAVDISDGYITITLSNTYTVGNVGIVSLDLSYS